MYTQNQKLKKDYTTYINLLRSLDTNLIGVGVTAFNRIGPAFFYPGYQIICYKDGSDLSALKKLTKISSIKKDFPSYPDIRRNNTLAILKHKGVQKYLKKLNGDVAIFLYRTTQRVDNLCDKLGFKVFANSHIVRDRFEDKKEFFKIGRKLKLPMIPGTQLPIKQLSQEKYLSLKQKIGPSLVFQLTDISRGGGQGTFFIHSIKDFNHFLSFVSQKQLNRKDPLKFVNVTKFIAGTSPSITACATKHGILTTPVQTQILDIKELVDSQRSGVYLGHDWSYQHFPNSIQKQAEKIATSLGEYMYSSGYRGIFGIDLIIDKNTNKVYIVECNPRYTGAFPVYSMLQVKYNEIPLDVFQLLEFFDINYKMDFKAVNKSWKQPKKGAHFGLHNRNGQSWSKINGNITAGKYKLNNNQLEKISEEITYQDLTCDDEFILTDGCPKLNTFTKPRLRIGKLIFKKSVLKSSSKLNNYASLAAKKVLEGFDIKPVSSKIQDKLDKEYGYNRS